MRVITNRNLKSKEGILNILREYIGVMPMCHVKYILGQIIGIKSKKERKKKLYEWIAESNCKTKDDLWKKKFLKLINDSNDKIYDEIMQAFYLDDIKCLKEGENNKRNEVTIVCVEKNEKIRMQAFLEHYRKIGIKQFLICDNGSTDGTLEYLMEQNDVYVYSTEKMYTSQRKAAWCNRMMADLGDNRWYFQADADEFAWIPEFESMDINEYVKILEEKKVLSVKAIMLEMYPNDILGGDNLLPENFVEDYCFYDADSEWYEFDPDKNYINGGFINRVFGEKHALQCKTPLFFQDENRFNIGSHHIYPYSEDITAEYGIILKHYKFLPGDEKKIRDALVKKNYANGSRLYKKFVELYEGEGLNAFYSGSVKWDDEKVLDNLPFIKVVSKL